MTSFPKQTLPKKRRREFSAVFVKVLITFFTSGWSGATPKLQTNWVDELLSNHKVLFYSPHQSERNGQFLDNINRWAGQMFQNVLTRIKSSRSGTNHTNSVRLLDACRSEVSISSQSNSHKTADTRCDSEQRHFSQLSPTAMRWLCDLTGQLCQKWWLFTLFMSKCSECGLSNCQCRRET